MANKYIDAEKLKAEIERRKMPFKKDIEDGNYPTYLCALMDFEELIDSLQQEQPEVDIITEIEVHAGNMPHCEFSHYTDDEEDEEWAKKEFRYFYNRGLNARKEE